MAHHLVVDAVRIEEIEPAARIVVVMAEGLEAGGHHLGLDGIEIVALDADMVERLALGEVVASVRHLSDTGETAPFL
jgi:hypothetical protein